jgi:phage tail-like protein
MDANGLRFWMLADRRDWLLQGDPPHLHYDQERRSLRLASERLLPPLTPSEAPEVRTEAEARLMLIPHTRDRFGTWAFWDAERRLIMAAGAGPEPTPLFAPMLPGDPSDLAVGHDGVLYIAMNGSLLLYDLRERWRAVVLEVSDFTAWRLAADPAGGVWVLDRQHSKLARLHGLPFPERPFAPVGAGVFRPQEENPNPPRLTVLDDLAWPVGETPVALACSPQGQLALLNWRSSEEAVLRLLQHNEFDQVLGWRPAITLIGAVSPYSLAWVGDDRVAVLLSNVADEAPVFALEAEATSLQPVGDFYPLYEHDGGPFVHGVDMPPHYPVSRGSQPLHHLSLPTFAASGVASNALPLDSGNPNTVWHRLYVEAAIPATGGVRIFLAASDQPSAPEEVDKWYEHQFGERFAHGQGEPPGQRLPCAAWVSEPSELPFHPGLGLCQAEAGRNGLFTVLIQRVGRKVRSLVGRYLHVRVELVGNKRSTPEVWALRAYGSRFSYVERYLPAFYRETLFGSDADAQVGAGENVTPSDFLERFVDNFESILTPLEDRIASSYLLTDPRSAPDEALAWLGSWIGVGFDSAYPAARRRTLIAQAPRLFRQRGTLPGLKLALDVATGGGVTGGEIVIVEDWRLRRTFATILGANLAATDDPLLSGLSVSGNSFVGDTLFLGDISLLDKGSRQEFLALFRADVLEGPVERQVVQEFFDRLAHRVTVLVHNQIEPQDLGLIRRIVELETPAHVEVRVVEAKTQFLVGMASLVGVDSYLDREPGAQPVRLDSSQVGVRDLLLRPASLDPRLYGGASGATPLAASRPQARLPAGMTVPFGASFRLDGSASFAAPGHTIVRYLWTRVT